MKEFALLVAKAIGYIVLFITAGSLLNFVLTTAFGSAFMEVQQSGIWLFYAMLYLGLTAYYSCYADQ